MKHYTSYTAFDFATDDRFLEWRLLRTGEATRFWEDFVEAHPEKEQAIDQAIRIVESVTINRRGFTSHEKAAAVARLHNRIRNYRRRRMLITVGSAAAAVLVLFFTLVSPLYYNGSRSLTSYIAESVDTSIMLILSGSHSVTLDHNADLVAEGGEISVITRAGKQPVLAAGSSGAAGSEPVKLVVPAGKRSSLVLPDGTKVWVNSGSTLEFPSVFGNDKREITVKGEIYAEVARDTLRPFTVSASGFTARVLGTKFDVSAYDDDKTHAVTVSEGLVEVSGNEMAPVRVGKNNRLVIAGNDALLETVSAYDFISWKDGILCFTGEPLDEALVRISRFYNISVSWDRHAGDMLITGKLVLADDPAKIFDNIAAIVPIEWENENSNYELRAVRH